jgi:hypothetical protein
MRTLGIVILSLAPTFAHDFHAGIQAGVPLTEYFEAGFYNAGLHGGGHYSSATRRYVIGAFAEWQPYRKVGVQAGLLYQRIGYSAVLDRFDSATGGFVNSGIHVYGSSWDFPLLAKYRFGRRVRPYLGAGGVLRYIGPVHEQGVERAGSLVTGASTSTPIDTSQPSDLRKRFYPGFTAAGGIEFRAGRLRIAPEIRYTRWLANISGPGGALRIAPNQVEFLMGFML